MLLFILLCSRFEYRDKLANYETFDDRVSRAIGKAKCKKMEKQNVKLSRIVHVTGDFSR